MVGIPAIVVTVLAGGCGEKSRGRAATPVDGIIADMVPIPGRDYRMGKTEVTQAQWEAVMGSNPSHFKGPDRPVENVSWNDCQAFIEKLNETPAVKEAKLKFRLPTSEEWEHACRAGGTGDWGRRRNGEEGPLDAMGWYGDNSGKETHPVAQKESNAWGLYDMHGNVWEWTSSTWAFDGSFRVFRGGGWDSIAWFCSSDFRFWNFLDLRLNFLGFRLLAVQDRGEDATGGPGVVGRLVADMVPIPGRDYRMGKTEVTQAQWEAVMGSNPSHFKGPDRPVESVSWDDCQAFIEKLNGTPAVKEAKLKFRLPTSEEWEHACRAGGTGDWGRRRNGEEGPLDAMGWYWDNSGRETHPVAQKEPNAWGLYDMHGNVWEWTSSTWEADGSDRVDRGGGWDSDARYCSADYRNWNWLDDRCSSLGFRLLAVQDR